MSEMTTDQIQTGARLMNQAIATLRRMTEDAEDDVRAVMMAHYTPGMTVDDLLDIAITHMATVEGLGAP